MYLDEKYIKPGMKKELRIKNGTSKRPEAWFLQDLSQSR